MTGGLSLVWLVGVAVAGLAWVSNRRRPGRWTRRVPLAALLVFLAALTTTVGGMLASAGALPLDPRSARVIGPVQEGCLWALAVLAVAVLVSHPLRKRA